MSQDNGDMTRRNVLKKGGVAATAAAVGGAGVLASTGSAAAVSAGFEANNAAVQTPDGDISQVYIAPEGGVEWKNFDEAVETVRVKIDSRIHDANQSELLRGWDNVLDNEYGLGDHGGLEGEFDGHSIGNITLYGAETDRPTKHFDEPTDGETNEAVVEVRITVQLLNGDGNLADPQEKAEIQDNMTFRATNTNAEASSTAGGTVNTGMSG